MTKGNKRICIVGAGGFAREVLCCLIDSMQATDESIAEAACFMVGDEDYKESSIMGIEVIRQSAFDPSLYDVVVGIGEPLLRKKVVESLPPQTTYISVIHPTAVMSKWVEIGEGSVITAGTILTCNVKIGKHVHLNLHTTIGHDCEIGDFCTTTPGVNVSGICKFGECVYLGTNSSIRQGINICDNVTIGMGGVVVKDITESGVYIGNPLKKMEKK